MIALLWLSKGKALASLPKGLFPQVAFGTVG